MNESERKYITWGIYAEEILSSFYLAVKLCFNLNGSQQCSLTCCHSYVTWSCERDIKWQLSWPIQGGEKQTPVLKKDEDKVHIYEDKDLAGFVDLALKQLDRNGDGYITYGEYLSSEVARNRADDIKARQRSNIKNWIN